MEKITKKETKYKSVKNGYTTKTIYKAKDGVYFSTQKACLEHEEWLDYYEKLSAIKQVDRSSEYNFDGYWFYCISDEELKMVKEKFSRQKEYWYGLDKMELNEWFSVITRDGGDYPDRYDVVTLKELQESYNELLKKLGEMK